MSLRVKNIEIDLKLPVLLRHSRYFGGVADEYRTHDFFSAHGPASPARVPSLRGALSGRLQGPEIFFVRPFPLPRLRPTHLSRESARHRGVFAGAAIQALPHGFSRTSLARHPRLCH